MCINKAPVGEPDGGGLAVQYPADLAWDGITCHVLDQRTLKMKQVRLDATMRMRSSKPACHPGHTLDQLPSLCLSHRGLQLPGLHSVSEQNLSALAVPPQSNAQPATQRRW